ncbi:TetR/AcrR family transcriptional regulator [Pseudomonas alloputida]|uniref:TetR/AcrR family transcriptional regulator n=1 Tax=Pseudomonas TaxID=286 RepID=UPI000EB54BF2|nr:TetR/AcrR family transcriptional regulator [Pseudomonas inefficax]WNN41316.1 TetR/AcrR family transcriptional regulator [Pseudomonas inefficax]
MGSIEQLPSMQERLRNAALDLFSANGFQSTSMRDLASQVGIHAGSLYSHIRSKQDLLFEIIEEAVDDLVTESVYQISKEKTFEGKLRKFVETYVSVCTAEWKSLDLWNREAPNLSETQRLRIGELQAGYVACLSQLILRHPKCNNISVSLLETLTTCIIGMLHALPIQSYQKSGLAPDKLVSYGVCIIHGAVIAAGSSAASR